MKISNNLALAKKMLLEGKAIIFPTDTVYGLGAIPSKEAIENLYSLKKRDKSKKIIALVSDIDYIKKIAKNVDYKVIKHFLPGPLSIIYETQDKFKDLLGPTIGIRIPKNKIAIELIDSVGKILMTTSANISGEPPAINISDISSNLLDKVSLIIETDEKLSGIPSTIVSYINNKYELIREGEIKFNDILEIGG